MPVLEGLPRQKKSAPPAGQGKAVPCLWFFGMVVRTFSDTLLSPVVRIRREARTQATISILLDVSFSYYPGRPEDGMFYMRCKVF